MRQLSTVIAKKQFIALLDSVRSIQLMGFVEKERSECIDPMVAWKAFASYDAIPSATLGSEATQEELSAWLQSLAVKTKIAKTCYLSLGGFGELPWAKLTVKSGSQWLMDLWDRLESHEMILMNEEKDVILGFMEEEYVFEAYLVSTAWLQQHV
jgi:hypothetical protein